MGIEQYQSRAEMVYEGLKKKILELELKPGEILKEKEICHLFDVSRTPVRDAIRLLEEQGFVKTVPYQGVFVTLLSLNQIKQMIYMRVAVETAVLRDFIKTNTPMDLEDIRYILRKQEALIKEKDFQAKDFYKLDAKLHSLWFEATKRSALWQMLQAQHIYYTRFRMLDFTTESDFTRIIKEHYSIYEGIVEKDLEGIEENLKQHLYYSMQRMRYQIDVEYKDYFEVESPEGKFDI